MAEQEGKPATNFVGIRLQEELWQKLLSIREYHDFSISDALRFCIEFTYQNYGRVFPLPQKDIENLEKLVASGRFEDVESAHIEIFHRGWDAYAQNMLSLEPLVDKKLEEEIKKRLAAEKNMEIARRLRKR